MSATTTLLLSSSEFCKLRYNTIPVKSASTNVSIIKVFYSPTHAQVSVLKNNIKIHIKIALTCFGAVTPPSGSTLTTLAKVTLVKIFNYVTLVCD